MKEKHYNKIGGSLLAIMLAFMASLFIGMPHVRAEGSLSLTKNGTYAPGSLAGYDEIRLNGYTMTVNGDFSTNADIHIENGHLIVNGNLTTKDTIGINDGTLTVNGNMTHEGKGFDLWDSFANIEVAGDFKVTKKAWIYGSEAATITVGGNLIYDSEDYSSSSAHKVKVAGDVTISTKCYWGSLVLTGNKTQKLNITTVDCEIDKLSSQNKKVDIAGYLCNTTLASDLTVTAAETLQIGNLYVDNYNLTINGNVEANKVTNRGPVNINEGSITVNGNYTQYDLGLDIADPLSAMEVTGDFKITKKAWIWGNAAGIITVGGNFIYDSTDYSSYYENTIKVPGDVTVSTTCNLGNLILTGSKAQKLDIASKDCKIYRLSTQNKNINISGYLCNVTLASDFTATAAETLQIGNLYVDKYHLTINGNVEANKDMSEGPVNIGEGGITINGNYTQYDKGLDIDDQLSDMEVTGDLKVTKKGWIYGDDPGVIVVGGNFIYDSTDYSYSNYETIKVAGNVEASTLVYLGNMVLNGSKAQKLTVTNEGSRIRSLAATNKKITVEGNIRNCDLLGDFEAKANDTISMSNVSIGDHKLTITGNVVSDYFMSVASGSFVINGNYEQKDGSLYIDKVDGKVLVSGNLTVSAKGYIGTLTSGNIEVGGNLNYTSLNGSRINGVTVTVGGDVTVGAESGGIDFGTLVMTKDGGSLTLPIGKINTLILTNGKNHYKFTPENTWTTLIATSKLTLNATGGSAATTTKSVTSGKAYGDLPTPTREGYLFMGWFDAEKDGNQVTATTTVSEVNDHTLYAHWQKNDYEEMLRLYNPNSGEHFYTANVAEKDFLVSVGWNYEGVAWTAPKYSNVPVYRLYNANAGDHHYTTNAAEKDMLVSVGWNYEGIGWYSDEAEGIPLQRLYNPNAIAGSHHYTISEAERDMLVTVGWQYEGIAWYGAK